MYSALDIAKYIITFCKSRSVSVSNLKLQKMLYFCWAAFFSQKRERLFEDDICAWPLGPVVPNVYYKFCSFAGIPIRLNNENIVQLREEDITPLERAIEGYMDIPTSILVDMSHESGMPWDIVYGSGDGDRKPIPFWLIEQLQTVEDIFDA